MAFHTPPPHKIPTIHVVRRPKRSDHLHVVPKMRVHLNIFEQTQGACRALQSPCEQTQCRYHLGVRNLDAALLADDATIPTCALEVAGEGTHTLDQVSQLLGVTKERVRQIEEAALRKIQSAEASRNLRDLFLASPANPSPGSEALGMSTSGLASADRWGFVCASLLSH